MHTAHVFKANLPLLDDESVEEYNEKLKEAAKSFLANGDKKTDVWPRSIWHNRGVFSVYVPGQERTKTVQMSIVRNASNGTFGFGDVIEVQPRTVYEPAAPSSAGGIANGKPVKPAEKDTGQVVKKAKALSAGVPALQGLLALVQAMREAYQVLHWNSKGENFYGDHLMFSRLYDGVSEQVDAIAEKLTGTSAISDPVQLGKQTDGVAKLTAAGMSTTANMLIAEDAFCQKVVPRVMKELEDAGELSDGLANFLQGIADDHEGNVYLLRQRLSAGVTKSITKTSDGLSPDDTSTSRKPAKKAEWSSASANDLPDAAFAAILPGGKKDASGKTVPRSLRLLPHHNKNVKSGTENGSVDVPHLRNALARVDQISASAGVKAKAKRHLEAHAKDLLASYQGDEEKAALKKALYG